MGFLHNISWTSWWQVRHRFSIWHACVRCANRAECAAGAAGIADIVENPVERLSGAEGKTSHGDGGN